MTLFFTELIGGVFVALVACWYLADFVADLIAAWWHGPVRRDQDFIPPLYQPSPTEQRDRRGLEAAAVFEFKRRDERVARRR